MVQLVVDPSTLSSPSAARRKSLRTVADHASSKFQVLETCPLERYMDVADRLLDRFLDAADEHRLDEAYVLGLRFANLCLSGLPRHPSWNSNSNSNSNDHQAPSHIDEDEGDPTIPTGVGAISGSGSGGGGIVRVRKARLTSETAAVLRKLVVLKRRMDDEEVAKVAAEAARREALEVRRRESEDRFEPVEEEERHRENAIRESLDREREAFRASQRHRLARAAPTTTTTTTTNRRPMFHRIWSK